jgi:hypothetical protein
MRIGITIKITRPDRHRLEAITRDRNTAQKHVWRANIVLLSTDGVGTNEIMRQTGTSKTYEPARREAALPLRANFAPPREVAL